MSIHDCGRAPELLAASPLPPPPSYPTIPSERVVDEPVRERGNPTVAEVERQDEKLREELETLPDEDIDRLCSIYAAKRLVEIDGRWGRARRIKALVACGADTKLLD